MLVMEASELKIFNLNLPINNIVDASQYELGATLMQECCPVEYASQTTVNPEYYISLKPIISIHG